METSATAQALAACVAFFSASRIHTAMGIIDIMRCVQVAANDKGSLVSGVPPNSKV